MDLQQKKLKRYRSRPRAEKSKSYFRRPKRRNLAKNGGARCVEVSLARWTVSEGIAQALCENVIWNRIYEVCWKKYTSKSNADQLECHESAASSKESGTSDDNVISDVIVISRSTSRIAKSADGLVMMSLVTTSCSADEERPAGAKRISRCATRICYLEIEIEKRCRLHKLIRQRFALALKIQQMLFALITSSCKIPAGSYKQEMLAGFTTEEAEADTVADQGLKRVNRIFGGLNEGIWPKMEELTAQNWNIEEDDESVDTSKSNADQLECHESAASSKESGTSDDNVISDVIVISRSTSRIAKSADGLVMMSLVTTSCSADEERPAGAKRISRCATRICYLEIEIEKRCRLHKLIRQRFALALKIQQMLFALITSSCKIPAGSYSTSSRKIISRSAKIQTQRKNSAEAQSSSRHESAAKQLTIYESWMSTAELKFKWAKATVACKRKGRKYCSLVGTLQRSVAPKWKEDKIAI
ncbi:lysM domain-containing GPI-anchored protein 2 [Dorcoceras hygrometricum]|uniref:LysM domain-containing GPI-anchored protein 2 n=1 Tax=Dorcoceras hygrometricum TaxID=472368 RepID=A0A2Z7C693_9LAMI|nr:lysM domain-containing GPI-anchored protein 2 [Dorcoceras hygrometricum]